MTFNQRSSKEIALERFKPPTGLLGGFLGGPWLRPVWSLLRLRASALAAAAAAGAAAGLRGLVRALVSLLPCARLRQGQGQEGQQQLELE